jgi:hypothetical protein
MRVNMKETRGIIFLNVSEKVAEIAPNCQKKKKIIISENGADKAPKWRTYSPKKAIFRCKTAKKCIFRPQFRPFFRVQTGLVQRRSPGRARKINYLGLRFVVINSHFKIDQIDIFIIK